MHYPSAMTLRIVASTLANVSRFPTFLEKCFSMVVLRAAEGNMSLDIPIQGISKEELRKAKRTLIKLGYTVATKYIPMIIGTGTYPVWHLSWEPITPQY